MISRRDKQKVKKANQSSLLSVENRHNSNSKKIMEVKDRSVKVRVTMDSGVARHVTLEGMFLTSTPFKTNEEIHRCMTFRSASVVKLLISIKNVVRAGNIVVLDNKNQHIQNIRVGTMIMMDVNNGVCTMDMWICLDDTVPVLSWHGQQVVNPLSTSL